MRRALQMNVPGSGNRKKAQKKKPRSELRSWKNILSQSKEIKIKTGEVEKKKKKKGKNQ
jgi:hypothetical protein